MPDVRVNRKTARLLRILLATDGTRRILDPDYHMPSTRLMNEAGVGSGSFYPIIARLERHGWVEGEWEVVPDGVNRPRRRFYHLTDTGVTFAERTLLEGAWRATVGEWIRKALRL